MYHSWPCSSGVACAPVSYLVQLQALAPLGERDAVVVVLVAAVQEGCDAVLQRHQRRADREQLVTGNESGTINSLRINNTEQVYIGGIIQ